MAKAPEDEGSTAGYRRPPKSSQFKKGQSGNPGGRPKRNKNEFDDKIISLMDSKVSNNTTVSDVLLKSLTREGAKGNIKAIKLLFEYHLAAIRNQGKSAATDVADREAGRRVLRFDPRQLADLLEQPQPAEDCVSSEHDDNAD